MFERDINAQELPLVSTFLSEIDLFKSLHSNVLKELASSLKVLLISGGETLIQQDEIDSTLYILWHGRLKVYRKNEEQETGSEDIAEISVGQIVGEISLLTDFPRTATVRAIRDSVILKLTKANFLHFQEQNPASILEMAKIAIQRLIVKKRATQPGENMRTISISPAGNTNDHSFSRKLVEKMESVKPTLLMTKERCNAHFGKDLAEMHPHDPEGVQITQWFNSLEKDWGFIIYETDPQLTPWTERCLRQADRVILVGDESASKELNSIEKYLFSQKERACIDLIVLHPAQKAEKTAEWFEGRILNHFHHVCLKSDGDFERVIRFLTGSAVGVVLNGGGARGFAHAGVLKALEKMKIPIDYIGGTSAGAIIGAIYSKYGFDRMLEVCNNKGFVAAGKDYTLPIMSVLKGRNATRLGREVFGETQIEDLWTPFFCVSTDATKGVQEVHQTGPLWLGIRASTSLPGVYPPIFKENGNMLVDGGVVNKMPVDVMRKVLGGGKILAVNCQKKIQALPVQGIKGFWFSGWWLFFLKLFKKNYLPPPSIMSVVRTSLNLAAAGRQREMEKEADYLVEIDTSMYKLLKFDQLKDIIAAGYEVALEQLSKSFK
jgi:predicted acylesterase/phospholipase RssA